MPNPQPATPEDCIALARQVWPEATAYLVDGSFESNYTRSGITEYSHARITAWGGCFGKGFQTELADSLPALHAKLTKLLEEKNG